MCDFWMFFIAGIIVAFINEVFYCLEMKNAHEWVSMHAHE